MKTYLVLLIQNCYPREKHLVNGLEDAIFKSIELLNKYTTGITNVDSIELRKLNVEDLKRTHCAFFNSNDNNKMYLEYSEIEAPATTQE